MFVASCAMCQVARRSCIQHEHNVKNEFKIKGAKNNKLSSQNHLVLPLKTNIELASFAIGLREELVKKREE